MKNTGTKQASRQTSDRRGVPGDITTSSTTSARRGGFTLIEIMVVLIIVGILMALLLPAIMRARLKAQVASVKTEISQLSNAIEEFKARYGMYPPSRIILRESPTGAGVGPYQMTTTDHQSRIEQRTVSIFQRIWPNFPILTCQFDFDGDGTIDPLIYNGNQVTNAVDYNGDGDVADILDLNGAECLAFFLGGMPLSYITVGGVDRLMQPTDLFEDIDAQGKRGFEGFSRLPLFPFSRSPDEYFSSLNNAQRPVPGRDDRFAPLYEFPPDRLVDFDEPANTIGTSYAVNANGNSTGNTSDGPDGMWEFLDRFEANRTQPYLYFSSYGGTAYNSVSELRINGTNGDGSARIVIWDTNTNSQIAGDNYLVIPYYSASPVDTTPQIIQSQVQWFNPRSFQIIAASIDGNLGFGGRFSPDTGDGPWSGSDGRDADLDGLDEDADFDMDNITNFSEGRLAEED